MPSPGKLEAFLNRKVTEYNTPRFIDSDPVCIPHSFSKKQDIEIAGFFAAILAWGNRTIIIKKSRELMSRMDNSPHSFCLDPGKEGLKRVMTFKHRTFNATDILWFMHFLQHHYRLSGTLETAFTRGMQPEDETTENALMEFHRYFFSLEDAPVRTRKHIATPAKKSTCKRLNMFLRWMVRKDDAGVDFGIWNHIRPDQLVCPIDLHVARVAQKFRLVTRKQTDWQAALELTKNLKKFCPGDPVKYDFALFGLGMVEKF